MNIIETISLSLIIEIIAVIFGIVSVLFAYKENIRVFPFGIINVSIIFYIVLSQQLYANAGINIVYFVTNVYGWYNWSRKNDKEESLQISRNSSRQNLLWFVSAILLYGVITWILRTANQNNPEYLSSVKSWIDGMNASFFLIATILMTIKKIENWWFWIAGNILSIPIFISQANYWITFQYVVFLVIAIMGLREWNKRWAEKANKNN